MAAGPFEPTWESLGHYEVPEWFRDAKFGIFAHWGPQCRPEGGDWYARNLYVEGSKERELHLHKYGHPSKVGFKDVCHDSKAEKFDPDRLLALYKAAGTGTWREGLDESRQRCLVYDSERQTGWRGKLNQLWDRRNTPWTAEDIRFTHTKDGTAIHAIVLAVPTGPVRIAALGTSSGLVTSPIAAVTLLGSDAPLDWKQEAGALVIQPVEKWPSQHAVAFLITPRDADR